MDTKWLIGDNHYIEVLYAITDQVRANVFHPINHTLQHLQRRQIYAHLEKSKITLFAYSIAKALNMEGVMDDILCTGCLDHTYYG